MSTNADTLLLEGCKRKELVANIDHSSAVVFLSAAKADILVYSYVGYAKFDISSRDPEKSAFLHYTADISMSVDLIYGISFDFPVKNFRLFIQTHSGREEKLLIHLPEAMSTILFRNPISRFGYERYSISYEFETGKDKVIDSVFNATTLFGDYKALNPIITAGCLSEATRDKLRDARGSNYEVGYRADTENWRGLEWCSLEIDLGTTGRGQ